MEQAWYCCSRPGVEQAWCAAGLVWSRPVIGTSGQGARAQSTQATSLRRQEGQEMIVKGKQPKAQRLHHIQSLRKSNIFKILQLILNHRSSYNKPILQCTDNIVFCMLTRARCTQSQSVGQFISPWHLQGMQCLMQGWPSENNSRQFLQSSCQQTMKRPAHLSVMQGNAWDSPSHQVNDFTYQ